MRHFRLPDSDSVRPNARAVFHAAIDTLEGKEVEHDQVVDVVLINKDNIADFDVTDWQ